MNLILLPIFVLQYWYFEAPLNLLVYFYKLNRKFFHLFSLPLMVRTFFKPWKNEYRDGLVGISIFMGMVFKTLIIISSGLMFLVLLLFEVIAFILFLTWPLVTIYLVFSNLI